MRRTQKLLITSLVIGAAVGLILWNTAAETTAPALGVAEAKRKASDYAPTTVAVRGTVVAESIRLNGTSLDSFVIADSLEQLQVRFNQTPPDNFGPKEVVVYGSLKSLADGSIVLDAQSIQVGCSSKY
jgi:cytochrome c-type biogenesis protein CcmE